MLALIAKNLTFLIPVISFFLLQSEPLSPMMPGSSEFSSQSPALAEELFREISFSESSLDESLQCRRYKSKRKKKKSMTGKIAKSVAKGIFGGDDDDDDYDDGYRGGWGSLIPLFFLVVVGGAIYVVSQFSGEGD